MTMIHRIRDLTAVFQIAFWRLIAASAAAIARRRRTFARLAPHLPLLLAGAVALAAGRLVGVLLR